MEFDRKNRSDKELLEIYRKLVTPRLIEEKMLILLRQGKISKWFSGIGQEAISVGATVVLKEEEYTLPMHRNLGVFTSRNVSLQKLFAQFQGKKSGFTKGRDRSFHFGTQKHKIVGMISHLGAQLGVADGIALAKKLRSEKSVTCVFTGDGGASEGDFHEALNVAAVWKLPVLFIVENNGYGLSTPNVEQFNFESFVVKGPAYGMEAHSIDGNNILEVIDALENINQSIREQPRPVLVEARTFRMRGHEEASGTKYVPKELMHFWSQRDPIEQYEKYLTGQGLDQNEITGIQEEIKEAVNIAIEEAFNEPETAADEFEELEDVYATHPQEVVPPNLERQKPLRFVDAISLSLKQSLKKHSNLLLMGQDIAEYGGVFKVTEGFADEFGKDRIRNTPICESAIIGAGLGLSIAGFKSVVEMQFADFVSCGFNQIVNNLAKAHYRWGQKADVVIRLPTGAGVGAGPFHSQSTEAWFFHTPGLKILYPSNPKDALGLLNAAIEDPNPCLFFEHKALYRSITDDVPVEYYTEEVGKGTVVTPGEDLTIISYGMGVHWAMEEAKVSEKSIEVIDLRTLLPWDTEIVRKSISKTHRALILHEDSLMGGIGAEIASWIMENCFEQLDAPVLREGSLNTPVPFAKSLEDNFLPKKRLRKRIEQLIEY